MAVFLARAWRQQPQYPVDPGPEWRVAFNAATSPQSTDSTGVHWRLQGTTNDWLARARVALPPHGIAFQAEQFYGGDDSISGVHSGGAGYLFPREQGTLVALSKVVTPVAYQPAINVSNGGILRGDGDDTWVQLGGNIWTTGQTWSSVMDGMSAIAVTWGDFGRRLYKNGQLLASTSTAPSSTAHSGTLNVGGDGMRHWMCAISGEVLDAGSLSENPWQVFRPRTARIYSFPSGASGNTISVPAGNLSLTGFAPTVLNGANQVVNVPTGSLTLTGHTPTVVSTANQTIAVPAGSLIITGYAPTVRVGNDQIVVVPAGSLTLTGYAPTIVTTNNKFISVPVGTLILTGYAPTVIGGEVSTKGGRGWTESERRLNERLRRLALQQARWEDDEEALAILLASIIRR